MEGEGEGGRCRERGGIPRERKKKQNKNVRTENSTGKNRREEKKTNKRRKKQTDKQEKNRKPVNQGKSYMRDCPDVDL